MGLFFAAMATLTYFLLVLMAYAYGWYQSRHWIKHTATIVSINDEPNVGYNEFLGEQNVPNYLKHLKLTFHYQYTFAGKDHQGCHIFLGDAFMDSAKTTLQPYRKLNFKIDDVINIYLDKKAPSKAVVYRVIPRKTLLVSFLTMGFSLICLLVSADFTSDNAIFTGEVAKWVIGFVLGFLLWFFDYLRAKSQTWSGL